MLIIIINTFIFFHGWKCEKSKHHARDFGYCNTVPVAQW